MLKNPLAVSSSEAEVTFIGISGVKQHFSEHPFRLVEYIAAGVLKKRSVVGVHVLQLANKVEIRLKYEGVEYEGIPEMVNPNGFDNIGAIIKAGREKFPSPKDWH